MELFLGDIILIKVQGLRPFLLPTLFSLRYIFWVWKDFGDYMRRTI